VEGTHEDTDLLLSWRSRFQAPEIDGTIIINEFAEGISGVKPGEMGTVEITEVAGYDLVGTMVKVEEKK
jgi:ribosomal protein S12 methylthiotransferase